MIGYKYRGVPTTHQSQAKPTHKCENKQTVAGGTKKRHRRRQHERVSRQSRGATIVCAPHAQHRERRGKDAAAAFSWPPYGAIRRHVSIGRKPTTAEQPPPPRRRSSLLFDKVDGRNRRRRGGWVGFCIQTGSGSRNTHGMQPPPPRVGVRSPTGTDEHDTDKLSPPSPPERLIIPATVATHGRRVNANTQRPQLLFLLFSCRECTEIDPVLFVSRCNAISTCRFE